MGVCQELAPHAVNVRYMEETAEREARRRNKRVLYQYKR